MDDLPNEIVEHIVTHMCLTEICSLRLVSRSLASKTTQDHFKSFFRTRRVHREKQSLLRFARATRHGGLGCLVTRLELSGIACDAGFLEDELSYGHSGGSEPTRPKEAVEEIRSREREVRALRDAQEDTKLLGEAFSNIREANPAGYLQSLSLKVKVLYHTSDTLELPALHVHDPDMNEDATCGADLDTISRAAADAFASAAESLVASGLRIRELDMFNGADMQRCSLPSSALDDINSLYTRLRHSLASLTTLSLSLSRHRADVSSDLVGLSRLVQITPALSELDLHIFMVDQTLDKQREDHLRSLALQESLPQLAKCRLRGLHVNVEDLCTFVQKTKPRTLHLEHVTARSGAWQMFFESITGPETTIGDLYMDDLFEQQHLIFDEAGKLKYGPKSEHGTHTLLRRKGEVKKPIAYHFSQSRMLGTPARRHWLEQTRLEYG